MVVFDRYSPGGHKINPGLLWEYDLDKFDLDKGTDNRSAACNRNGYAGGFLCGV